MMRLSVGLVAKTEREPYDWLDPPTTIGSITALTEESESIEVVKKELPGGFGFQAPPKRQSRRKKRRARTKSS